jgi:hypothetical protein
MQWCSFDRWEEWRLSGLKAGSEWTRRANREDDPSRKGLRYLDADVVLVDIEFREINIETHTGSL